SDLGFRNGRDLVHHDAAGDAQSIAFVWNYQQPKQRGIGLVGRECADRNRGGCVETVILYDDDGPCLADVVLAARDGPDVASCHSASSASAESESMKAWSSRA